MVDRPAGTFTTLLITITYMLSRFIIMLSRLYHTTPRATPRCRHQNHPFWVVRRTSAPRCGYTPTERSPCHRCDDHMATTQRLLRRGPSGAELCRGLRVCVLERPPLGLWPEYTHGPPPEACTQHFGPAYEHRLRDTMTPCRLGHGCVSQVIVP